MTDRDVDVVVIGSGAAGLTAALTAREAGCSVVVAESEQVVGGSSRLSEGIIMAAGTEFQKDQGIVDTPDDLYDEYLLLNQFVVQPGIVRRLADESAAAVHWLSELGVRYLPWVMLGGEERNPRSHVPAGRGQRVMDALERHCRARGIEIALGRRIDRLLVTDGRVTGVASGDDELRSGAVIIATGGIGASPELLGKHVPSLNQADRWYFYVGADGSRGDGLGLGAQVGADTVGHDRAVALVSPKLTTKEFDGYLPGWMLLLDGAGHRLCAETAPYGVLSGLVGDNGGHAFGFFDSAILEENGTASLPTLKVEYPPGKPAPAHVWTTENIKRMIDSGSVRQAATVQELARDLGLSPHAVGGAVERYNGFAEQARDGDFLKAPKFLRRIGKAPFYGVELRAAALGLTCYGLRIDAEARVMDRSNRDIPGLFAAGECVGGVLGPRYMGSGNSWTNCVVFGRAAGRSAALVAN
ncbi:FAD-dependent oxidoreductase [Mycobacterium vicinigordonae]|uniref:FAD-dependent oxidoreductase n=1 Tax=Mycobacterium vicinigordonae TaxID=1719132 RepID=A0A7D6ITX2_9MYCO|nr:FAD-dependent oxidoreductase [Mycobacterium vicinigordonae]QLL08719.1 FAD-dependent oxidoreductase [Mycobacterium vicinigordonae]